MNAIQTRVVLLVVAFVAARFVTMARFVAKVTKRVKFDAKLARFVTPARLQNVPKGPLAERFVTPSPATL